MAIKTFSKTHKQAIPKKRLEKKARLLDELVRFLEDKYFGYLMEDAEGEKNISLVKAKKLLS